MPKRLLSTTHLPGLGARFQSRDTDGDMFEARIFTGKGLGDTFMLVHCLDITGDGITADLTPHQARALRDFLNEYVPDEEPKA